MSYEFILPDIGEGVVEAEVIKWLVDEGEEIAEDQMMVEVMTDKATVQIPSPKKGKVLRRMVEEGKIALVGKALIVIDVAGSVAVGPGAASVGPSSGASGGASGGASSGAPGGASSNGHGGGAHAGPNGAAPRTGHHAVVTAELSPVAAERSGPEGRALAAPATRRLAREMGVDLQVVRGTGKGGRVTNEDVAGHSGGAGAGGPGVSGPGVSRPGSDGQGSGLGHGGSAVVRAELSSHRPVAIAHAAGDERIPLRGLRRKIAQKMQQSKNTAAHFTYVDEIDMTELVATRARGKKSAEARGVKLTFLPFIAKAILVSLRKFPLLNASLDDERGEIVVHKSLHLGIAAATEDGLIVPVIRDADTRSLYELAKDIESLGERARTGKLAPGEVSGSTFTITSLGRLGGLFATPIINHPEVAIIGIHEIKKRPVFADDGSIVARDIMLMSLSLDHRVIDGHVGAAFAQDVKAYLEDPTRLLLELS